MNTHFLGAAAHRRPGAADGERTGLLRHSEISAIGDPFHLSAAGSGLDIHVGVAAAIPEPSTWALLASGLLAVRFAARARVRR